MTAGVAIDGSMAALLAPMRRLSADGMMALSRVLSEQTLSLARRTARNGTDPYGAAWPALRLRSGQPLRKSGALLNSIALLDRSQGYFRIGTNLIYAAVHQFGATIVPKTARRLAFRAGGKKGGWIFAMSVTIPARPYLPTGDLPSAWSTALEASAQRTLKQVCS